MSAKTYSPCEEAVGWHMAQKLERHFKSENRYDGYENEQFEELEVLAATHVAKSVVAMGSCNIYLSDIGGAILSEILEEIADLLDKIHRLLTKPHTIIDNKYLLEDAFAAFFKRIYMEYALDKGMYRTHEAEFEAYRAAYGREGKYMDFYPWISGKCWNDFKLSGFLQPFSRDRGENIEELSRFNEIFPAPQYFHGDNYAWSLHADVGRYIYYYQLREDGWLDKTNSFLRFLMLIDLYRAEEHLKFENAQTDCLEKCVTNKVREKGMLHPFQQCLQRIHVNIEEDEKRVRGKEKQAWQKGDWRHVYDICKEKELIDCSKTDFAHAIVEAVMLPNKEAASIQTMLSQNSDNASRSKSEEHPTWVRNKIEEILSPITERVPKK